MCNLEFGCLDRSSVLFLVCLWVGGCFFFFVFSLWSCALFFPYTLGKTLKKNRKNGQTCHVIAHAAKTSGKRYVAMASAYNRLVLENGARVASVESTLKSFSFLLYGRFDGSDMAAEAGTPP